MKKKLLAILQYLFFAALAAFFVWLSLKDMNGENWIKLKAALHQANYWLLVPMLLLLLASHWLRALRWRQLMEQGELESVDADEQVVPLSEVK